jgi:hypothetical protein
MGMRKATSDYAFITDEDQFLGVSLGADFTSEHEWGIKGIREAFGIPESSKKNMGIKSRTITKCPHTLLFKRDKDSAVLWVAYEDWYPEKKVREELPREIANYKDLIKWDKEWYERQMKKAKKSKEENPYIPEEKDPMITAWDEKSFGVAVVGEPFCDWLEFLYEQFKKKNVAIAMMNLHPGNPFSNSSLTLAVLDRLPKEVTDMMYQADKKYYDLEDYEKKIGMVALKEKVKKLRQKKAQESNSHFYKGLHYYMACSPKWVDYEDAENRKKKKEDWKTKYDILYWINYSDDDSNYGWYTVEQIREWLEGDRKLTEVVPKEKED